MSLDGITDQQKSEYKKRKLVIERYSSSGLKLILVSVLYVYQLVGHFNFFYFLLDCQFKYFNSRWTYSYGALNCIKANICFICFLHWSSLVSVTISLKGNGIQNSQPSSPKCAHLNRLFFIGCFHYDLPNCDVSIFFCSKVNSFYVTKGSEFKLQVVKQDTDLTAEMIQRCV